jgi:ferric-dicitrate binding protein FerR (iron transport regulator)
MNMDDLIVKYLLGSADADETMRIERWLAAEERNRERLRQFRTLWDLSGRTVVSARPDTQEALGRLRQRLGRMRDGVGARRRIGETRDTVGVRREMGRGMLRKGLAAAVLAGLLCVGIVIFVVMRRSGNSGAAGIERTAKAGGVGTAIVGVTVTVPGKDTLPDGSVVTLASHSKFIYTPGLTGDSRTISLEGDADFSVVSDPARPFVVLAGDIAVRVLGTSFLVRSGPDSTAVNVTTGVVEVSRDKDSVIVRAGERLTVFRKKKEMVLRDGDKASEVEVERKGKKSAMRVKGGNDPKQVMRSIIDDLVKEKIVPDKDSVEWFGLDPQRFVVNGRVMSAGVRQVFTAKYIKGDGMGYYFEAEKGGKVSGTGYFLDRKDLY